MEMNAEQIERVRRADMANVLRKIQDGKNVTESDRRLIREAGASGEVSPNDIKVGKGSSGSEYDRLRNKKLQRQCELLRLEIRRMKGDLVEMAAVKKAMAHVVLSAREQLLQMPARIGPMVPFMRDAQEAVAKIQDEVDNVLATLAKPLVIAMSTPNESKPESDADESDNGAG